VCVSHRRGRHAEDEEAYTSSRVQPLSASVAFEVFRLLVGDEELEIFKVAFTCMEKVS
jgi:hypothetical protein